MDAKILVVEDETALATTIKDRLRKEGYAVSVTGDGESALNLAARDKFDLMVLDIMLPGQSGFDVCRKLRQLGSTTPILMLTARRQVTDKVTGLRAGADDYLTKPFQMAELLARIEALLRRAVQGGEPKTFRYQFGPVQVDL